MNDTESNKRMAFHTPSDRAAVLQDIDDGDTSVSPGTAMAHARATNLGAWGSRDMLREDCARLLIGEIQALGYPTPSTACNGFGQRVTLREAVLSSASFTTAFEHARYARELSTENNLRVALGHEQVHWSAPSGVPVADDALAAAVVCELRIG